MCPHPPSKKKKKKNIKQGKPAATLEKAKAGQSE